MKIEPFESVYKLERKVKLNGRDVWLEMLYTVKGAKCIYRNLEDKSTEDAEVEKVELIFANDWETEEKVVVDSDSLFEIAREDYLGACNAQEIKTEKYRSYFQLEAV